MPESHSETTRGYVAVRLARHPDGDGFTFPDDVGGHWTAKRDQQGTARLTIDTENADVAPWLSRSEQDGLLRALKDCEWTKREVSRIAGEYFCPACRRTPAQHHAPDCYFAEAIALLRERLARP